MAGTIAIRDAAGRQARHVPDDASRKLVYELALIGRDVDYIGERIGVSGKTVAKYYGPELARGADSIAIDAANYLAKAVSLIATGRARSAKITQAGVTAAIFVTKVKAKWREYAPKESDDSKRADVGAPGALLPDNGRQVAPVVDKTRKRKLAAPIPPLPAPSDVGLVNRD